MLTVFVKFTVTSFWSPKRPQKAAGRLKDRFYSNVIGGIFNRDFEGGQGNILFDFAALSPHSFLSVNLRICCKNDMLI